MEGKRMSAQEVKQAIMADVAQLAEAITQALNAAEDGHAIADTEEPVHDATAVFREHLYEKVLRLWQNRQGLMGSVPPYGPPLCPCRS
jgi:hypothetical protein